MRKILFRGFTPIENGRDKAFINGEWIKGRWVQGSYMTLNKTTYCFKEDYEAHPDNTEHYIVFDEMMDWGLPNRHLQADVIPETVGQYTGLTDKNGKKIFEGDIANGFYMLHPDRKIYQVVYKKTGFYYCDEDGVTWHPDHIDNFVVIGNIHDNPELLKGE